jgi:hypothetical protein
MKECIIVLISILLLIGVVFSFIILINNEGQLINCKILTSSHNTILDKSKLFDKCLILEDGDELTINEYSTKHKYDGIIMRE